MNKISIYFIAFIFPALTILPQQVSADSNVIFQDNFDSEVSGTFPSKWVLTNDPNNKPCNAEWLIADNKVGIAIKNEYSCTTNITPKDELWNVLGNKYSIKADILIDSGTDHNLAFGFVQENGVSKFYEIHFQSPNDFVLDGLPEGVFHENISKSYPSGNYSIEILVNEKNIKVYINNLLVRDFTTAHDLLRKGKIALRAGAGSDTNSITYYDDIIVTEISDEPNLNVPLIKQDDPLWKTEVYDSANLWYPADPSIARWGCALTSTVMVLKHYGIDKLPNNSLLTPKSLNEWMKQQPTGYMNGGNFNWYVIPKLVEQLQANDMIPNFKNNSLEYHFDKSPNRIQQLSKDLENNIPGILQVILNPVTNDSHFVVAKGIQDDTFILNDPLWERTLLTDTYNNDFYRLNRFVPSDSDLSYLVLETSQNIEISVTDSNGNAIGDHYLQEPITDPYNLSIDMGDPYKIYVIQKPETENYTIEVSSNENNNYVFNAYLYDKNANDKKITLEGFTSTSPDLYTINFNKDAVDESHSQKTVTFQSTIDDVNEAVALKLMNKGLGKSIIALLKSAEKDLQKNKKHSSVSAGKKLDGIEKMLDRFQRKKNLLTEEAYQILKYDIEVLKVTLK